MARARQSWNLADYRAKTAGQPSERCVHWLELVFDEQEARRIGPLGRAAATYVASLDRWELAKPHDALLLDDRPGGCRATLEHMGQLRSFVRAYTAERAEKARRKAAREKRQAGNPASVTHVPERTLRNVFDRLAGYVATETSNVVGTDGQWKTRSVRRFVALDLRTIDPNKPVEVPMPSAARPGRGGKRWSPTSAGWTRAGNGRWIELANESGQPSKQSVVTVKAVDGETRESAGRAAPATVKAVAKYSSVLSSTVSLSDSRRGADAPSIFYVEKQGDNPKLANRQSADRACPECFGQTCDCPPTVPQPQSWWAAAGTAPPADPEPAPSSPPSGTSPADRKICGPSTLPPTGRADVDATAVERNRPALLVSTPAGPAHRPARSDASQGECGGPGNRQSTPNPGNGRNTLLQTTKSRSESCG